MRQQHTPTTGMPEAHEKDGCGSSQSVGVLSACNIILIKAVSSLTPAFTATLLPCDLIAVKHTIDVLSSLARACEETVSNANE